MLSKDQRYLKATCRALYLYFSLGSFQEIEKIREAKAANLDKIVEKLFNVL